MLSDVGISPGLLVSAPGLLVSAPSLLVIAPGLLVFAPGLLVFAPGLLVTAPDLLVARSPDRPRGASHAARTLRNRRHEGQVHPMLRGARPARPVHPARPPVAPGLLVLLVSWSVPVDVPVDAETRSECTPLEGGKFGVSR